jgi:DNA polymerase III epsilon subunit family exonuclease
VKEILDGIATDLNRSFCGSYTGTVRDVEKETPKEEKTVAEEEEEAPLPIRTFPVCNYVAIDGADKKPQSAVYMADCHGEEEDLTVCGEIVNIQEKQTGKGKPFFTMTLSDGSARMRVTYFSKQATVDKIRALVVGDKIVCSGSNELFNGNLSYHAKKINRGTMPENYVLQALPTKSTPSAYHTVFPEPYEDYTQADLFVKEVLPADLIDHDFVVFDLETTGLNNIPTGGMMDSIIEIGAVKLHRGAVAEKFSTFVAYDKKLPPDIIKLTGITDEMLTGAPNVKQVIPDFYKFCDGCFLVGHNVTFDYRFIQHYAKKERYSFDQARYDTLTLGQELLHLPNYKLNTLADHYGITFNHHRAFDDALTTAKIFIQLLKTRKTLPAPSVDDGK